jgi:hypothetical protein
MSNFTFTSVDGATYEVQGPPTATFEQAKAVFAQQVSTGGLTGLPVGGLVNAVTQAAGGLSSALAQLGPNAISLTSQIGNYINLPNTIGLPIPNAITVSNFVNTNIASQTIGTIGSTQIQGLVAQTAASVNQATDVITNAKGLGQFGFNADQLQLSGLIKPGVAAQINLNPTQFTSILSSPTSWTGKLGATDLTSVLSSASLQTTVQQGLMSTNFDQLKQIGTITGLESAQQLGPLVNVATKFGAGSATEWLSTATGASGITSAITSGLGGNISGLISSSNISGLISGGAGSLLSGGAGSLLSGGGIGGALSGGAGSLLSGGGIGGALSGGIASVPGLTSIMNGFAASAQFADAFSFASSFLGGGGNPLEAGTVSPPPAVNTVNRQTVNQAVKAIIGNSKIPIPDFAPPGTVGTTSSGGLNSLISSATSTINSLTQSAGGAIFNV